MSEQKSTNSTAKRIRELKRAEAYILENRERYNKQTLRKQLTEIGVAVDIVNFLLDNLATDGSEPPGSLASIDTPPPHNVTQLIDRLFVYKENHKQLVENIISIGAVAIPELLRAFREREFRHAQNQTDTDHNTARLIATSMVEIAKNEQDPLVRDRLAIQMIEEMTIHVKWQIEMSFSSRGDFERYQKAFDDNLFHKACESALAMGGLKDARALPYLLEVIQNRYSHPTIRENAIIAVGQIGDEKAIPHLIDLINKHEYNTHFAIDALAKMGNVAAVPSLLNTLETVADIDNTRAHIIWAVGQLHDPQATSKLIDWVQTHKDDMRAVAIQALGNIGDPSAIPILENCLNDATVLHRQDYGGTFWLFRSYRRKKICDMAADALKQIGTPGALRAIEKWHSSRMDNGVV